MKLIRRVMTGAALWLIVPLSVLAVDTGLEDTGHAAGFNVANTNIPQLIGSIIGVFLSMLGVLFMVLLILAGYEWMTAQGEEKKVKHAKDRIQNSLIGIIIVVMAYAISGFVLQQLINVAKPAGTP